MRQKNPYSLTVGKNENCQHRLYFVPGISCRLLRQSSYKVEPKVLDGKQRLVLEVLISVTYE